MPARCQQPYEADGIHIRALLSQEMAQAVQAKLKA